MNPILTDSPVAIAIEDGVAEMRFNRPDRLNAVDVAMAEAFRDAVNQVLGDGSVRVILLYGEGRAFLAGGDLTHFRDSRDRADAAHRLIAPLHEGLNRMVESRIPTIAAVHGAVAGAGMSIACLTDLAIAADNTRFSMAYIKIAASPDCGGSWALTRLVGHRKAAELALLSDTLDAQEALRLGLVNRVVPHDRLLETARLVARRIAAGPSDAMQRTRRLIDAAPTTSLEDQLAAELEGFVEGATSGDFEEALDAFFAKRTPNFVKR